MGLVLQSHVVIRPEPASDLDIASSANLGSDTVVEAPVLAVHGCNEAGCLHVRL